jgi:integrase
VFCFSHFIVWGYASVKGFGLKWVISMQIGCEFMFVMPPKVGALGEGNKDRFVPLPVNTYEVLRRFWRIHQHPTFIFPNRKRGLKYAYRATSHLNMAGAQLAMAAVVNEMA